MSDWRARGRDIYPQSREREKTLLTVAEFPWFTKLPLVAFSGSGDGFGRSVDRSTLPVRCRTGVREDNAPSGGRADSLSPLSLWGNPWLPVSSLINKINKKVIQENKLSFFNNVDLIIFSRLE